MKNQSNHPFSRRAAIKAAAGCGLMSNTALLSTFLNLQATKTMAATTSLSGYKAIVCVFLAGAIDSFNVLVPRNTDEYANYSDARNGIRNAGDAGLAGYNPGIGLGLRDEDFVNTSIMEGTGGVNSGGRQFGLHPGCAQEVDPSNTSSGVGISGPDKGIAQLYREGHLALLANVGSLPYKITRSDYDNNVTGGLESPLKPARPLGLFSHSDLQRHWQTSVPQSRAQVTGWGGRMSDLFESVHDMEPNVSMNMSMNGINLFQTGDTVVPYAVGLNGADELDAYGNLGNYESRVFNKMTDDILGQTYSDLVVESFRKQTRNSIDAAEMFNAATSSVNLATPFDDSGNDTSDLSRRLKMVARIIGASDPNSSVYAGIANPLNQTRQVFFVEEGGWDHHANMITSMHAKVPEVSKALTSFYRALEELGVQNDVITFTASDFGRTLRTNGIGSDHGWGGNHIMMGGCVEGGRIYGKYPSNLNAPADAFVGNLEVGRRRLIPTTSVDEFAGEMAHWFGVDNQADLKTILPNIGEFYSYNESAGPLGMINELA